MIVSVLSRALLSACSERERTVARSSTSSTTRFTGLPPFIILTDKIAASSGFMFRLMTVWSD